MSSGSGLVLAPQGTPGGYFLSEGTHPYEARVRDQHPWMHDKVSSVSESSSIHFVLSVLDKEGREKCIQLVS